MKEQIRTDNDMIAKNAPVTEPERQFYYSSLCRDIVEALSARKGRPLKACVKTFGCQMNSKDSEKLMGILKNTGYELSDDEDSDFVLYNTCTVREHANLRVYGRLGVLKQYKDKNPDMIIAMCGCMMQEPQVVEKIKESYRHVSIIFGTHNIYKLAELLYAHLSNGTAQIEILEGTDSIVEDLPSEKKYGFKCGVNIMYGCNNFCSYCIVPYVRGRERSRKSEDIIAEVNELADGGVVEVMLLGQNVNSYAYDFPALLRDTAKIDGIKRIRFMTSHPKDLSDELIDTIAQEPKIARHIHLPLQSGSSRILQAMNRHYTGEDYLKLVTKIRDRLPDVSVTTDIIVGFPGETEEDFKDTLKVCRSAEFDSAFTFIYSRRSGTKAAEMPDQIPKEISSRRMDELLKVISETSAARNARLEGSTAEVLAESINAKDKELINGRLSNNSMVHFRADPDILGSFVNVRLTQAKGFYYNGELI